MSEMRDAGLTPERVEALLADAAFEQRARENRVGYPGPHDLSDLMLRAAATIAELRAELDAVIYVRDRAQERAAASRDGLEKFEEEARVQKRRADEAEAELEAVKSTHLRLARALRAELERKDAALREIADEKSGWPFKVDPLEHARAVVEAMRDTAARALAPVADQTGETRPHPYVKLAGHQIVDRPGDVYGLRRYCKRCGSSEDAINAFGWRCATTEDQTGETSDG